MDAKNKHLPPPALCLRSASLFVAAALCSAIGIITIKISLTNSATHGDLIAIFLHGPMSDIVTLGLGLFIYAVGVVLGIYIIGKYPLSVAYPAVIGLSLVALTILSYIWLSEAMGLIKLTGMTLVIFGVYLLSRSRSAG